MHIKFITHLYTCVIARRRTRMTYGRRASLADLCVPLDEKHYITLYSTHRQSLNDTDTIDQTHRSSVIFDDRDASACRVRALHARSLFKDHQVTPIGPMLRAASSIFIVNIVSTSIFQLRFQELTLTGLTICPISLQNSKFAGKMHSLTRQS